MLLAKVTIQAAGLFRAGGRLQAGGEEEKMPRTHMLKPPSVSVLAGTLPDTHFTPCMPTGQTKNTTFVAATAFSMQLSKAETYIISKCSLILFGLNPRGHNCGFPNI